MIFKSKGVFFWMLMLTSWVNPVYSQTSEDKLETMNFPVACNKIASEYMQSGLALLHHMTYSGAEKSFRLAIRADSDCAMGYWGIAMTYIHPLWPSTPDEAKMREALELLNKAKSLAKGNKKNLLFIRAVESYYEDGWTRSEKERLTSFDAGWRNVYQQFPDDPEAASFYALARMSSEYLNIAASPSSKKDYSGLEAAGAIVEEVLMKWPKHPGAHHYIIHAYDMDGLAERALAVARNYGELAPDVSHTLHMPSHIFTRLGLWEESISWNIRSAAAGLKNSDSGTLSHHFFHAADYLVYAYLQTVNDKKAKEMLDKLNTSGESFNISAATAYTLAAAPGRYVLERRQWADAAKLKLIQATDFPWERFPQFVAIFHFTRAIGSARNGNELATKAAIKELATLHDRMKDKSAYWAIQVEIQHTAAKAWLQVLQGKQEQALKTMRNAAEMEASTYKHPITPGQVIPARELLGDLLLEIGRPEKALVEYQSSLEKTPNRFNSLYGAGQAAEASKNQKEALFYYKKLLALASNSDSKRAELAHAKAFVSLSRE